MNDRDVLPVSRLTALLRDHLDRTLPSYAVAGEISGFRQPGSGHWYFTLKDEFATLDVAMFVRANRRVRFRPRDGDAVIAVGRVEIFSRRGALQLVAERLEPVGAGRLQARLEELKRRLQAEGLFDSARKQRLPRVPRRVGIVTSRTAAALHDMLRVIQRRDPTLAVTIAPCRVQGQGSAETIVAALERIQRTDVEVILLGRGGGSFEDLWAFNEEVLVRAVAACRVPVVCGVGHEIDVTLADFAADARAATPTAAAELAVPVRTELVAALQDRVVRLTAAMRRSRTERVAAVAGLRKRLVGPRRRLDEQAQRLDELQRRLEGTVRRAVQTARERTGVQRRRLSAVDPSVRLPPARARMEELRRRAGAAVLRDLATRRSRLEASRRATLAMGPLQSVARGYAIAVRADDDALLRSERDVQVGDRVRVRLADGGLGCVVEERLPAPLDPFGRPEGHDRD